MAIQDSNPERRNLSVLSVAIILFYLGEGKLTDTAIRFSLVPIVSMGMHAHHQNLSISISPPIPS